MLSKWGRLLIPAGESGPLLLIGLLGVPSGPDDPVAALRTANAQLREVIQAKDELLAARDSPHANKPRDRSLRERGKRPPGKQPGKQPGAQSHRY